MNKLQHFTAVKTAVLAGDVQKQFNKVSKIF